MPQTPAIAIIDDDDGVRSSLSSLIRSLGYGALCYESALDFLMMRDSGGADPMPGFMIIDVQMPGMTGDQLQAELVARGWNVPTIFLTAFPSEATRSRVMAAGALDYLDKPADGGKIADYLAQVLHSD